MVKNRLIATIIVRDGRVVQSEQFNHTNVIHYDAVHAIDSFTRWSVDEIILLNVSRERSSQHQFLEILSKVSQTCFVPISAGGWIDNFEYASQLVSRGCDKLVVNTSLYKDEELIRRLIKRFGKQCIVASVDYKYINEKPLVQIDRGKESIGLHPVDWCRSIEELGVGELYVNCIDRDGKRKGYDLEVLTQICESSSIPVIAFGGVFRWKHLHEGIQCGADAVAAANIFHYTEHATKKAKRFLQQNGVDIRPPRFIHH